jgi:3-hydroxybutyryl-CoA dehydrogenase
MESTVAGYPSGAMGSNARSVGLFGTGVMARGIAELCLANGLSLVVRSSSEERAAAFRDELVEANDAASVSCDPRDLASCDLFLEATVEEFEPKARALRKAEPQLPSDAVMASTTSSLSITALASCLERPERMVGLHFFNPVHRMPLVEVVAGLRTSEEAVQKGRDFAHVLGKRPLRVPDGAGFLVNRLLIPYLNQAVRLVESGYATVQDVDKAMVIGAGHPMGPFALIDLIGADVCVAIAKSLDDAYHRTSDAPPPILHRRVSIGWLGRKTGKGYFDYPRKSES